MMDFVRKFLNYVLRTFINNFLKIGWRILHWLLLNLFYKKLSITSYISINTSVVNRGNISIGKNVVVNRLCVIRPIELVLANNISISSGTVLFGKIYVGDDVLIGPNVSIMGGNHNFDLVDVLINKQGHTEQGIFIENNVWIGSNVVILDGVTIGEGAVIGGGSVVTKDIPKFAIAIGNPARVIKYRHKA